MQPKLFVMVGGFLGAGKTTIIAQLARRHIRQGRKVGIVTNDQAYNLVDTQSLRAQGFDVGEVPGACFCCKFDDLLETAAGLGRDAQPDIILAEPVGSCTDLAATVIEPLRALHGQSYRIAPLAVLLKPEHGAKILRREKKAGFSPQAAYIFLKQLEEADIIGVNKIDKLTDQQQNELIDLAQTQFPGKTVMALSGRRGDGLDELFQALDAPAKKHQGPRESFMNVDYDTYAAGEAELGWLNCQVAIRTREDGQPPFSLDELVQRLVNQIRGALLRQNVEPAHLKVMGYFDGGDLSGVGPAIANLVDSIEPVELSLASGGQTHAAECIVNARVAADPQLIEHIVSEALAAVAEQSGTEYHISGMQRFRPGRPTPTHRVTASQEAP